MVPGAAAALAAIFKLGTRAALLKAAPAAWADVKALAASPAAKCVRPSHKDTQKNIPSTDDLFEVYALSDEKDRPTQDSGWCMPPPVGLVGVLKRSPSVDQVLEAGSAAVREIGSGTPTTDCPMKRPHRLVIDPAN